MSENVSENVSGSVPDSVSEGVLRVWVHLGTALKVNIVGVKVDNSLRLHVVLPLIQHPLLVEHLCCDGRKGVGAISKMGGPKCRIYFCSKFGHHSSSDLRYRCGLVAFPWPH